MTHPILARLASPDPAERRRACELAAEDPTAVVLVETLCGALGDPSLEVSQAASHALERIGRTDDGVRPALRRALRSDDPRQRLGAALTETRLDAVGLRHVPVLVEALDVRHASWTCARLLVEAGRSHAEVLPLLLGLSSSDERPRVRRMAVFCLRDLAPDLPETAMALLAAADDPDVQVRRAAFTAMAGLLDPPVTVRKRLLEAVSSAADPASRRIAALSLGAVAGQPPDARVLEALHELRDEAADPDLRRAAQLGLSRAGVHEAAT